MSDPGDAHRLIARFVRTNEEKTRSMTVSATDPPMSPQPPSPGIASSMGAGPSGSGQQQQQQRVFPFPSMRRQTTLGACPHVSQDRWGSYVFFVLFRSCFTSVGMCGVILLSDPVVLLNLGMGSTTPMCTVWTCFALCSLLTLFSPQSSNSFHTG